MQHEEPSPNAQQTEAAPLAQPGQNVPSPRKSGYIDAGYQVQSDSPEWDSVMESMADEIRVRHYSRKTLKI